MAYNWGALVSSCIFGLFFFGFIFVMGIIYKVIWLYIIFGIIFLAFVIFGIMLVWLALKISKTPKPPKYTKTK